MNVFKCIGDKLRKRGIEVKLSISASAKLGQPDQKEIIVPIYFIDNKGHKLSGGAMYEVDKK